MHFNCSLLSMLFKFWFGSSLVWIVWIQTGTDLLSYPKNDQSTQIDANGAYFAKSNYNMWSCQMSELENKRSAILRKQLSSLSSKQQLMCQNFVSRTFTAMPVITTLLGSSISAHSDVIFSIRWHFHLFLLAHRKTCNWIFMQLNMHIRQDIQSIDVFLIPNAVICYYHLSKS